MATAAQVPDAARPKALVVPHAGYVYSGPIAAQAYARVVPDGIERVVLLGPSHRMPLRGLAVTTLAAWSTPLGEVPLVPPPPGLPVDDAVHALEHSLEVQVPFLQFVLGSFSLLPLMVGDASVSAVAQALDALWGGPETLIVVSTDLSHYLKYAAAQRLDRETDAAICALDADALTEEGACGRRPLAGLLSVARKRDLSIERVDLRNSGDTAGPRDRVVGYGAYVLW